MKVRISNFFDNQCWYRNLVGETIEVKDLAGRNCYLAKGMGLISKQDCEVIEEDGPERGIGSYERLATEIGALVDTKQAQYGDAITKVGDVLAIMYPDGIKPEQYVGMGLTVRVLDKLFRVANGDQGEESAFMDITGYGLLGAMQSKKKEDPAT